MKKLMKLMLCLALTLGAGSMSFAVADDTKKEEGKLKKKKQKQDEPKREARKTTKQGPTTKDPRTRLSLDCYKFQRTCWQM